MEKRKDWLDSINDEANVTVSTKTRQASHVETKLLASKLKMDEISRDKCAILSLVLKGKWYDMIEHGKKHEEYRDATDYWARRLDNWDRAFTPQKTPVVEFRRGYASNAPRMAFWCFGISTVTGMKPYGYVDLPTDKPHHPEWGEPAAPHFFIRLGGSVKIIN